jgi:peptide methionine sulfoxide reductase msrA/msrB
MRSPILALLLTTITAVAFVVLLAMSGCGGASSSSAPAPAPATTTTTTTESSVSPDTNKPAATDVPPVGEKLVLSDAEWKARLTPEIYKVMRNHATEPAFCGTYVAQKKHGVGTYHCASCAAPLFTSDTKFESGTGWPSFFQPLPKRVGAKEDNSHGMVRTEVHCARCEGHLGHLFDDGPPPTGLRFCINAIALTFKARPVTHKATFGAGCFWGVEATFRGVKGVVDVAVGYAGGNTQNPTYEQICNEDTGHAEVVEIDFDPSVVNYEQLLMVFWDNHDPTTLNRQGPDVGSQYRSVIFTHTPEQRTLAMKSLAAENSSGRFKRSISTVIQDAPVFWRGEEYHQRYAEKHGVEHCRVIKSPPRPASTAAPAAPVTPAP